MAIAPVPKLPIPDPPEGHEWKYALLGETLAVSHEGKDLVTRLEAAGIVVEILKGGGYQAQYQPELPRQAQLRAFFPDEGIIKP